jgi:hypothetical protein
MLFLVGGYCGAGAGLPLGSIVGVLDAAALLIGFSHYLESRGQPLDGLVRLGAISNKTNIVEL